MNAIIEKELPVDAVAYVERLDYEMQGYMQLINYMATAGGEGMDQMIDRYQAIYRERALAMAALRDEYVPEEYRTPEYDFRIMYAECLMTIGKAGEI